MCGIFATTQPALWRPKIDDVLAALGRRGPDASGKLDSDEVLLGHTRLSIIGLGPEGAQPATSGDGTVSLTFNGEIYNYRELANSLLGDEATSDTRVLAELLAKRPVDDLTALRGMYAFASWDRPSGVLTAMRDPFGIKPLYALQHSNGGVTLSSELGPLLLVQESRRIDRLGLAQYLVMGHTGPTLTLFEPIHKLAPGVLYRWRRLASGGWEMSTRRLQATGRVPTLPVADALEDSVRAHLVADVEVGTFLSGGVDSTLITAIANNIQPGIRTFTLSFPDAPSSDESALAEANAALIGTKHTTVPVTHREMAQCARTFIREHGEPFGDAAGMPLMFLAQAAALDVKVVLCGEGADELFGGYGRYRVSRRLGAASRALGALTAPAAGAWSLRRPVAPWARAVEAVLWGGGVRSHAALLGGEVSVLRGVDPKAHADILDLLQSDWRSLPAPDRDGHRAREYDRTRWLPNVYLEKTDRATMAASLEARVPFLDPVVAAAAAQHLYPDTTKAPLRAALFSVLPGVKLPDRKKGLAVDTETMVRKDLRIPLQHELADPGSILQRWAGQEGCAHIARRCERSSSLAFRIAMLGLWEDEFSGAGFACTS